MMTVARSDLFLYFFVLTFFRRCLGPRQVVVITTSLLPELATAHFLSGKILLTKVTYMIAFCSSVVFFVVFCFGRGLGMSVSDRIRIVAETFDCGDDGVKSHTPSLEMTPDSVVGIFYIL